MPDNFPGMSDQNTWTEMCPIWRWSQALFWLPHHDILEIPFGIFQIILEVTQQDCMRGAGLISQTLDIIRRYWLSETQGGKKSPLRAFVQSIKDKALISASLKFRIYTRRKNLVKTEKCTSTWARSCPISWEPATTSFSAIHCSRSSISPCSW